MGRTGLHVVRHVASLRRSGPAAVGLERPLDSEIRVVANVGPSIRSFATGRLKNVVPGPIIDISP